MRVQDFWSKEQTRRCSWFLIEEEKDEVISLLMFMRERNGELRAMEKFWRLSREEYLMSLSFAFLNQTQSGNNYKICMLIGV